MGFVGRVGEPVGFDDGPDDDDGKRNACQNAKGNKDDEAISFSG